MLGAPARLTSQQEGSVTGEGFFALGVCSPGERSWPITLGLKHLPATAWIQEENDLLSADFTFSFAA